MKALLLPSRCIDADLLSEHDQELALATCVTIFADEDVTIDAARATDNFGSATSLRVGEGSFALSPLRPVVDQSHGRAARRRQR